MFPAKKNDKLAETTIAARRSPNSSLSRLLSSIDGLRCARAAFLWMFHLVDLTRMLVFQVVVQRCGRTSHFVGLATAVGRIFRIKILIVGPDSATLYPFTGSSAGCVEVLGLDLRVEVFKDTASQSRPSSPKASWNCSPSRSAAAYSSAFCLRKSEFVLYFKPRQHQHKLTPCCS